MKPDGQTRVVETREFICAPSADGDLEPFVRKQIRATLKAHANRQIEIRIRRHKLTRSEKANRYYWSVVLALLAKDQEMTPEEMHDAMCVQFLPNEAKRVAFFNRMTGETLEVETDVRRSSKLKGDEFFDFVERVRLWGLEFLGVMTPDPDPDWWRKRNVKALAA